MKKKLRISAIPVLLIAVAVMCACAFPLITGVKTEPSQTSYPLCLSDLFYDEETLTVYAEVKIAGEDDAPLGVAETDASVSVAEGFWFNRVELVFSCEPDSLYSAVENAMTQDEWTRNGVAYTRLIVFFRYDTIYKSYSGNGVTTHTAAGNIHRLQLDPSDGYAALELFRDAANTANWYAVLLSAGLALGAAAAGVSLAVKNARNKREAFAEEIVFSDGAILSENAGAETDLSKEDTAAVGASDSEKTRDGQSDGKDGSDADDLEKI